MLLSEALSLSADLTAMKEASGSNAKRDLAVSWGTPLHAEFLELVGNANRQWFITWEAVANAQCIDDGIEWDDLWGEAESRQCKPTTTAGRIKQLLFNHWPENVLKAIVDKTPDCGLSIKEFLKARGVKKPFVIALASDWCKMNQAKRDKHVGRKVYASTPKMDGLRCFFVLIPGKYAALSRAMKPLKNLSKHLEALKEMYAGVPCCIDGEIMGDNWNESVTAVKSSSGGHIKAAFYPFDLVTAEEYETGVFTMPKAKRLALLNKHMKYGAMFKEVPFEPVFDCNDVLVEFKKHLTAGFEGSVLHDMTAVYRPDVSKSDNRTLAWIKVKEWKSAEFKVVGFMAGTGKHMGRLGALVVEGDLDGKHIKCEVGTGLTDSLREEIWADQAAWKGAVCEIKYFEATEGSLRFPSFLRRRTDME
jgi:ATP-dependent DNA ligase